MQTAESRAMIALLEYRCLGSRRPARVLALGLLRLAVGLDLLGFAVGADSIQHNLAGAAVIEQHAVGPIGFELLRLLGRQMDVAGENPFARGGRGLLLLKLNLNVF